MTTVTATPFQVVVRMEGIQGRPGAADTLAATVLTAVLTTDQVVIVRNGALYLANIADVLAAAPPSGASDVLGEDGGDILQEDGSKILTEDSQ